MAVEITKPLLKAGVSYAFEIARCLIIGIVLSVGGFLLLWGFVPSGSGNRVLSLAGALSLAFPFLYALAGHQRGMSKVLSTLTSAHGGVFFDQTLGRFIDATEARRPGGVAALLAIPQKFTDEFRAFLADASFMPRWLKRVALHYVGKLGARVGEGGLLPTEVLSGGRLHRPQFRQWAVDHMQDQFAPSWQQFGVLSGMHLVVMGLLGWMGR